MKKATKLLITAAAVAAVAGVSAVSFAAWSAQDAKTGVANGSVGNVVSTIGDIKVDYKSMGAASTLSVTDKLVPYDQDLTNKTAAQAVLVTSGITNVNYMVFEVTNTATDDTNVIYKIHGSLTGDNKGNAKLWYKVGDTSTKPSDKTDYTELPETATAMTGFTKTNNKVTIILDASANEAVGATWSITFTAEQGAGA